MNVSFELRDDSIDLKALVIPSTVRKDIGQAKIFERATLNPIFISIDKCKRTFIARKGEEILGSIHCVPRINGDFRILLLDSYKNKTYKNIGSTLVRVAIEYYICKGFPGSLTVYDALPKAYEFYRKLKFRPIFSDTTLEESKQLKKARDEEYADINARYLVEEEKIRLREDLDEEQRSLLLSDCLQHFASEKASCCSNDMELPKKHIDRLKDEIFKNPILNITKLNQIQVWNPQAKLLKHLNKLRSENNSDFPNE